MYNYLVKKLFLSLMFTFFVCNAVCAKSIEFSAVSDTLLETDNRTQFRDTPTPSIETLFGAIEQINNTQNEFVIFCGDNIAKADKYSLVMFAKILRKISLNKPVYVGIGEKDVAQTKGIDKKEYYRVLNIFSQNRITKLPQAKKINGFVFLFMDGVNQFIPSQYGYYKENELMWLDKTLEKYKDEPVIIVQHYPVFAPRELDTNKLPNKVEAYRDVLLKHNNVIAIISGHHNIEDEVVENGIYNISLQSLGKCSEYKKINIEYDDSTKKAFIKTRIYKVEKENKGALDGASLSED